MSTASHNLHATAITVDGIGLLFLGPSGSGKSGLAFDCISEARLAGLAGALISDDRVLLSLESGNLVARGPAQIRGLIELRYSGIASVDHVEEAHIHYAIFPVGADEQHRLPPDDEMVEVVTGLYLPVIRVPNWSRFPLNLIFARIRGRGANR